MASETIFTNKSLTNAIYTGVGSAITDAALATSNVQEFTGPGTWAKPTGNFTQVRIECIGGGGGGSPTSGGGGGGFSCAIFPFGSYSGPQTVTVAASGGAAGPVGSNGTPSVFGPGLAPTYGLTGWAGSGATATRGGGGGGMAGAGGPVADTAGAQGGGTGSGTTGTTGTIHGTIFGGGGGGGPVAAGGSSVYGAGGGGGATSGAAGPSIFGGAGGAFGANGSIPGGGGGSSGAGARGSVRVITF